MNAQNQNPSAQFTNGTKVMWLDGKYDSYTVFSSGFDNGVIYTLQNPCGVLTGDRVREDEIFAL